MISRREKKKKTTKFTMKIIKLHMECNEEELRDETDEKKRTLQQNKK